jgi:steroid 5-alpha reductase family enzyme
MSQHKKPFLEIAIIYLIIGVSGYLSYKFIPIEKEIYRFLVADLVMTVVTFAFSLYKKNSSVYDAYWSVIPFYFILLWWANTYESWTLAHYLTAYTVSFWSWRLTHNWYRSWPGWEHEDWRYVNFRKQFGKNFQPINFLAIHLYPTLIVFLSMTSLFYLYDGTSKELNIFIIVGNIISFVGVWFEYLADNTLFKSRFDTSRIKGTCIRDGIWGYTRNPNYLGEMLFWVGLVFIGFGVNAPLWTGLGAVGMILMFLFASIPMKEKRLMESRTDFEDYKSKVSMLIPSPPKK